MITIEKMIELAKQHKYILLRDYNNHLIGFNLGSVKLMLKQKQYNTKIKLNIQSYIPCDLNTYITYKIPFL